MAAKKVPMRMCVGCRVMRPKKKMLRVVRSAEGKVSIDPTGKAAGRGAYICRDIACLERAIKSRGLERAFEQKVEPALYETLKADFVKQYG
ncbi:MAG TPA: YlxR family protein [Feifaniaceae bacterium]|nr:YlxR family protein [Feifaniaceae bacterium]